MYLYDLILVLICLVVDFIEISRLFVKIFIFWNIYEIFIRLIFPIELFVSKTFFKIPINFYINFKLFCN